MYIYVAICDGLHYCSSVLKFWKHSINCHIITVHYYCYCCEITVINMMMILISLCKI